MLVVEQIGDSAGEIGILNISLSNEACILLIPCLFTSLGQMIGINGDSSGGSCIMGILKQHYVMPISYSRLYINEN